MHLLSIKTVLDSQFATILEHISVQQWIRYLAIAKEKFLRMTIECDHH